MTPKTGTSRIMTKLIVAKLRPNFAITESHFYHFGRSAVFPLDGWWSAGAVGTKMSEIYRFEAARISQFQPRCKIEPVTLSSFDFGQCFHNSNIIRAIATTENRHRKRTNFGVIFCRGFSPWYFTVIFYQDMVKLSVMPFLFAAAQAAVFPWGGGFGPRINTGYNPVNHKVALCTSHRSFNLKNLLQCVNSLGWPIKMLLLRPLPILLSFSSDVCTLCYLHVTHHPCTFTL